MGHGKKKRERKAAALHELATMLDGGDYVPACTDCGGARVVVQASQVPAPFRESLGPMMSVQQYTYCPSCGGYAALGGWESF